VSIKLSRPRYEVLDAMRGVAACGVLMFHLSIVGAPQLFFRGYLAVDLFFILSGFVISYAYAARFPAMSATKFLKLRGLRILPLSILATIFGSSYFILRRVLLPNSFYGLDDILGSTILNIFLIPKLWMTPAPTDTIFPTNTPLWSLSLEMAVNLLWAFFFTRITTAVTIVVVGLAGLGLSILILNNGSADLGAVWPSYVGGVLRALFGFGVGTLIYRFRPAARESRIMPWVCMICLLFVLCMRTGGAVFDVAAIIFVFPILIFLAVSVDCQRERRMFTIMGDLSYPLYVIHVPILVLTAGTVKALHLENAASAAIFLIVPFCVLIAAVLNKFYDAPVRLILKKAI
jgi:peptidoglycan/LPS O-acetylase OafA/YrhL